MNLYVCGGAVRDILLGLSPKDIDYVVVGSTPEEMLNLQFKQVGVSFPVFLSPEGNEYALARTERKTGVGYQGFEVSYDPSVTLEDDLLRRDLSINSMAVPIEHWDTFVRTQDHSFVIDPHGGLRDLNLDESRRVILRHVSEAFVEDPLRVIRVARFAARYSDVRIAPETLELMKKLVKDGEIHHLTPERVWIEIEKGMDGTYAHRFIRTLADVGALEIIFPELAKLVEGMEYPGIVVPSYFCKSRLQKIALLFQEMKPELTEHSLYKLKAPTDVITFCKRFSEVMSFERRVRLINEKVESKSVASLFDRIALYRQPQIAQAVLALALEVGYVTFDNLESVIQASHEALNVTFASLTPEQQISLKGKAIAEEIARLRLIAIETKMP